MEFLIYGMDLSTTEKIPKTRMEIVSKIRKWTFPSKNGDFRRKICNFFSKKIFLKFFFFNKFDLKYGRNYEKHGNGLFHTEKKIK